MKRGQSLAEMKAEMAMNLTAAGEKWIAEILRDFTHHNARCTVVPQEDIIDIEAREVAEPLALPEEAG